MGLWLDNLHRDTISQKVIAASRSGAKMLVVNANAQMMVLAQNLPWMKSLFAKADIAFCDGAGVQLAARILQRFVLQRTTPPEWIGTVLAALGPDASIFWLGGKPEVVALAAKRYEEKFGVRTAGIQHGYFDLAPNSEENLEIVARINAARPTIILVNMGMPRQERWIWDNWERLNTGVVIAAGALVDHAAGIVHRPPSWVSDIGFEWLVRLLREPRRLWRRYLIGLPVFAFYIMRFSLERRREHGRLSKVVNQK
jgi:N-acetylglucosaminyldiphosphoundecaprenol N-acetyl-beta-D-mannosaminyltransferase